MKRIKWVGYSILAGILAGASSALFLHLLNLATEFREMHRYIIWALPVAGLFIGWVYRHYAGSVEKGNSLIIEEVQDPKQVIPLRMTPLVLGGTLITHLFGGSAGREGTAVQMGASLSDQLSRYFKISREERRILLVAGSGAGFGAAVGAPWAGAIFGMEVIRVGRLDFFAPLECVIASFVAYGTAIFLKAPHSVYPSIELPVVSREILFSVVVSGLAFGFLSWAFIRLTHGLEVLEKKYIRQPIWRPALAGILLCLIYAAEGSYRFAGLGIPVIQSALVQPATFDVPAWKLFLTALTVGSGFKGGEFIPLVFMGTTLGSALGTVLPAPFSLLGALGFASVFGSASNTPLACTVMAMEIFGPKIGAYAFAACFISFYVSGFPGIYRSQAMHRTKRESLRAHLHWVSRLLPSRRA